MREIPAAKTAISASDFARSALKVLSPEKPSFDALALLTAHSALETRFWRSCYCFNLGNAKGYSPAGACTYYDCGENLSNATAQAYLRASPDLVYLAPGQKPDAPVLDVRFKPKHPMCRFQAFESLDEAMAGHLGMLRKTFPKAWDALQLGDPKTYAHALKLSGYYTAGEAGYAQGLVNCLGMVRSELLKDGVDKLLAPTPELPAPIQNQETRFPDSPPPPPAAQPAVEDAPPVEKLSLKPSGVDVKAWIFAAVLVAGAILSRCVSCPPPH